MMKSVQSESNSGIRLLQSDEVRAVSGGNPIVIGVGVGILLFEFGMAIGALAADHIHSGGSGNGRGPERPL